MKTVSSKVLRRIVEDLRDGCEVIIVCFGDSITAGYGVTRGFPFYWKGMLQSDYPDSRIDIINSGLSGDTTIDGLARLESDVLSHNPDLVTVNFGINDAVMGIDIEDFKKNEEKIVSLIQGECGSEILLLSSPPLESSYHDKLMMRYNRAVAEVAGKMNVRFLNIYEAWIKRIQEGASNSSLILPGLDHPNEEGYKIIAEEIMNFFH